jgi:hypothetical protein
VHVSTLRTLRALDAMDQPWLMCPRRKASSYLGA